MCSDLLHQILRGDRAALDRALIDDFNSDYVLTLVRFRHFSLSDRFHPGGVHSSVCASAEQIQERVLAPYVALDHVADHGVPHVEVLLVGFASHQNMDDRRIPFQRDPPKVELILLISRG